MKLPFDPSRMPIDIAAELIGFSKSYIKKAIRIGNIEAEKLLNPNSGRLKWYVSLPSFIRFLLNVKRYPPRDRKGNYIKGYHYSPATEFKKEVKNDPT